MARSKATVYLDPEVLRAMRIRAARTGRRDSDVVEDALREYLGLDVIDRIRSKSDLSSDEALRLAYEELDAMRRERRAATKR
jgi:plasmid stability protein